MKSPRPHNTYHGSPNRVGSRWAKLIKIKDRSIAAHLTPSLNRSRRWKRAKSYQHAREIGPSAEVVR